MPQPRPRQPRAARGPVAASVATSGALLAHLIGGGSLPGWLGIAVPFALSLMVCTVLAGRRLSLWRTTASVAVSQLLFHLLFVLGGPAASSAATGHGMHTVSPPPVVGRSSYVPDLIAADATMWTWHGVAAAVTVAWLYCGERALLRLRQTARRAAAWWGRRLPAPADAAPQHPVVHVVAPDWFTGSFPARPEVSSSRRRGPPRACVI